MPIMRRTNPSDLKFPIHITIDLSLDTHITAEDIAEVRRLADENGSLSDDDVLVDLFNELVETKAWPSLMDSDSFDWSGTDWDVLFRAVRESNPQPIPEIPGQTAIDL